jgi:hypothetical protein
MPQHYTVADLIADLHNVPAHLPVRLAVQPDFPFAHYVGGGVAVHDGIAYIAEDGQDGYLPPAVCEALSWT